MSGSNDLNKMATLDQKQVFSGLLSYGLSSYKWGKKFTVAQLPMLEKPLDFAEAKVASLTTDALSCVKTTPEGVVTKLDTKALDLIVYFDVEPKYTFVKTSAAKQMKLLTDAKDGARAHVSGLQAQASHRVDTLLTNTEALVDSYLPAGTEGANEADNGLHDGKTTTVARIRSLPMVTSRRLKKRAMAKFSETRYAELLDLQAVRERVEKSAVGSKVLNGESYAVVKGFVLKASAATNDLSEKLGKEFGAYKTDLVLATNKRVLTPAKDFYATATAEFIKLTKFAEDFKQNPKEEFLAWRLSAEEFTAKYVAAVKAALGEGWSEKLAKPTESFLGFCKSAYEQVQKTCPQGQAERLEALVTALRSRLAVEWEARVKPALQKLKAQ